MSTMIRTQIQLTAEQMSRLRRIAASRGVSVAELVRETLDRHLTDDDAVARRRLALESVGGFHSGRNDVSEEHDRYLTDDLAEDPKE